eukprot:15901389-Heterocapsa_arctica.AAC.1
MDEAVYQKTIDEADLGLINGPHTEAYLTDKLGPLWLPARRFGIKQGDYRPIDDYSEHGHNS